MLDRILMLGQGRTMRKYERIVGAVNAGGEALERATDADLSDLARTLRERAAAGEPLDSLKVETFALTRELSARHLGQRPYDVQILAGAVLDAGRIAEMATGEGKTLAATLPVTLNALAGQGVHVATANEYLAARDAAWMGKIYAAVGLSVGVITSDMPQDARADAYRCDITYGTASEFGFDLLRDSLATDARDQVQRGHHMAVVDEADSILIDEARTPLIIAGPALDENSMYMLFARKVAEALRPEDGDYEVDRKRRAVLVTEQGYAKAEQALSASEPIGEAALHHHLERALQAKELYRRDRDYVISSGEIIIVDENTGRPLDGRRYQGGLHQAIEAKEGLRSQAEQQTIASITIQNYFRRYAKLAGMTGTAAGDESELEKVYRLGVTRIPPNRPNIRTDHPAHIHATRKEKHDAIVEDVDARHRSSQPVLIGTTYIDDTAMLSRMLTRRGIPHNVLNAKNLAKEADIIAEAGAPGAVTVATNMAGRGTDILLGGSGEESREIVLAAGGLCVIGTGLHEARRIDDQLRGRAARQGDPGETVFHLSLEDDLVRTYAPAEAEREISRLADEGLPAPGRRAERVLLAAQERAENAASEARKETLKYDEVLSAQREHIFRQRQELIAGSPAEEVEAGRALLLRSVQNMLEASCPARDVVEDWDLAGLSARLGTLGITLNSDEEYDLETLDRDRVAGDVTRATEEAYDLQHPLLPAGYIRNIILDSIDLTWQRHLNDMEELRESVQLRAWGQQEPIVEYRREAHTQFQQALGQIADEVAQTIMSSDPKLAQHAATTPLPQLPRARQTASRTAGPKGGAGHVEEVPRNSPCPCGSGKKYKRCHMPR